MRLTAIVLCAWCHAGMASAAAPRELVHPFLPTGPLEVAGVTAANKVLRTMQHYAMPPLTDILATHVAHTLQGADDLPIAVIRRPRRGGREAVETVAAAAPDGRTLLLASGGADGLKPVATVASMPYVFVAGGDSKIRTLGDLVREARERTTPAFISSPGDLTAGHAAVRAFRRAGLTIEPLGYNGGYAALQAAAAKQVSAAIVPLPAALPYLPGGKIRALAIAESARHPAIPDVPTTAESGFAAVQASTAFVVFAPAATPAPVLRDLEKRLARGAESEPARHTFHDLGLRLF